MAQNILLTNRDFHPDARRRLEEKGFVVHTAPDPREETLVALINVHGVAALYTRVESISRSLLERCPSLRVICSNGVGVDHIDVAAASELGVLVLNLPLGPAPGVAEHTIALLLALARGLFPLHARTRAGGWPRNNREPCPAVEIAGRTLFILGFGVIGRLVAAKAQGLNLQVAAYDPFVSGQAMNAAGVQRQETLMDGLATADFVSVHLPLTAETQGLFGREQFRRMKPSAYFLSLGRGKVVREDALYHALWAGWIAGAAMDVFETEPPAPNNPLFDLPNLIATPHVAGITDTTMERLAQMGADSIQAALTGQGEYHLVNGAQLQQIPKP